MRHGSLYTQKGHFLHVVHFRNIECQFNTSHFLNQNSEIIKCLLSVCVDVSGSVEMPKPVPMAVPVEESLVHKMVMLAFVQLQVLIFGGA